MSGERIETAGEVRSIDYAAVIEAHQIAEVRRPCQDRLHYTGCDWWGYNRTTHIAHQAAMLAPARGVRAGAFGGRQGMGRK